MSSNTRNGLILTVLAVIALLFHKQIKEAWVKFAPPPAAKKTSSATHPAPTGTSRVSDMTAASSLSNQVGTGGSGGASGTSSRDRVSKVVDGAGKDR